MLLQVHDELVLEVAHGEREAVEKLVTEQMGSAAQLTVPLDVQVGVGSSWYDAGHQPGEQSTGLMAWRGHAAATVACPVLSG